MNIYKSDSKGYEMIFSNQKWGVGYKNYSSNQNLVWQRHLSSDEGFILLSGKCCLLTKNSEGLNIRWLEKAKLYLVPKNEWHFNLMFKGAEIFIVENNDVSGANTENIKLKKSEIEYIKENKEIAALLNKIS